MEERLREMGRRERIEKGSHCFFKYSGYDKLVLKHKNLVFSSLWNALFKKRYVMVCKNMCHCNKLKSLS